MRDRLPSLFRPYVHKSRELGYWVALWVGEDGKMRRELSRTWEGAIYLALRGDER